MSKQKMAVVCNGDTLANIMPTLIFANSGLALDYEVHIFVCPAGARWFLTGELEKLGTPKGMPNPRPWRPVLLRGHWCRDQWGDSWLQVDEWRALE